MGKEENKLEKLYWTNTGFLDVKGNLVNPILIGTPYHNSGECSKFGFEENLLNELKRRMKKSPKYNEVNSYSVKELTITLTGNLEIYSFVNFLKK